MTSAETRETDRCRSRGSATSHSSRAVGSAVPKAPTIRQPPLDTSAFFKRPTAIAIWPFKKPGATNCTKVTDHLVNLLDFLHKTTLLVFFLWTFGSVGSKLSFIFFRMNSETAGQIVSSTVSRCKYFDQNRRP